jgi:hypothetical protein
MFHVFARSWKGLNLSPGERASMKFVEGVVFSAVGAGGAIAFQQLTSGSADYHQILPAAGGAALLTVVLSVKKYLAAQTDVPLADPSLVSVPNEVQAAPTSMPPSLLIPTPQAGGSYVPPPPTQPQFMQPGSNVTPLRHFGDTGIVPVPTQQ